MLMDPALGLALVIDPSISCFSRPSPGAPTAMSSNPSLLKSATALGCDEQRMAPTSEGLAACAARPSGISATNSPSVDATAIRRRGRRLSPIPCLLRPAMGGLKPLLEPLSQVGPPVGPPHCTPALDREERAWSCGSSAWSGRSFPLFGGMIAAGRDIAGRREPLPDSLQPARRVGQGPHGRRVRA